MNSTMFYLLNLVTLSVFTGGIGFIFGYGVCCEMSRAKAKRRRDRIAAMRRAHFKAMFEARNKAKKEAANTVATTY